MTQLGLLLPEGKVGNFTVAQSIDLAQVAETHGFHSVWRGESYSTNAFINLGATARHTEEILLGTAITNVFSRPPTLIGMNVATVDALSSGRTILGLGASTDTVIEEWYGLEFEQPLRRTRETIEILRQLFCEEEVDYYGEIFDIGRYPAGFSIDRDSVPIYNAALGELNCRLTGEYADGWLPLFIPAADLRAMFDEHVTAGAKAADRDAQDITVAPIVITAVTKRNDVARQRAREALAQVMSVGYNEVVGQFGFAEPADAAATKWREGDREGAVEAISDAMVDELTVHGTPERAQSQLAEYEERTAADFVITMPPFTSPADEIEYLIESLGPATQE